jgi:hypothetical protein
MGIVFTRLGGISRLAFVYRCADGSVKKIPAGIGRKGESHKRINTNRGMEPHVTNK